MSKILLVHGAWHGAWCWDKVVAGLTAKGREVEAIDLPGHGDSAIALDDATFDSYVECICNALDKEPEPVILAVHSMGGITATQAAELRPEKIRTIVYIAAMLPRDGQSLNYLNKDSEGSLVAPNLILSEDFKYMSIKPEAYKEVFYADCSDEDIARCAELIIKEPFVIADTPVQVSEKWDSIPRVYVRCSQDMVIPTHMQDCMLAASPCMKEYVLEASHSPFLSMPDKVVEILEEVDDL